MGISMHHAGILPAALQCALRAAGQNRPRELLLWGR